MSETHVDREVVGLLKGVVPKANGWHDFEILEPGKEWPLKPSTKKKSLIDEAMALMGQQVRAVVKEGPGKNLNPNTGEPYTDRWLNEIAAAGDGAVSTPVAQEQQSTGQPAQQQAQPGFQQGLVGHAKDISIWRQTATKVVAMSLDLLPEEQRNITGFIEASEALVHYYQHGPYRFGVTPGARTDGENLGDDPVEGVTATLDPALARVVEGQPCPDCGFSGTHAMGCPQADFAA